MLSQLHITNLRNLTDISFQPASGINLILGDNGAGKTTLLEAIHILSLAKSFRTRTLKSAVQFGHKELQIIARTDKDMPVGLNYSHDSGLKIRLNSAPLKRTSELAVQLPLQFIPANCHQFFEKGPRYRRQLLDWGLFHVEPSFNFHWQSYRKSIQQRNSALRQHKKVEEIQLWDAQISLHGEAITQLRQIHLEQLLLEFKLIFARLCPSYAEANYEIKYKTGWLKGEPLAASLVKSISRDRQLGYTRSGSHAADWSFRINDIDPADVFSRGQQKLFYIALCMAQAKITAHINNEKTILLLDDISSELDAHHQNNVLEELTRLPAQVFLTATNLKLKEGHKIHVFHVEHGTLQLKNA
ncbi:MAG: DNA replication/repair protein RecF [Gammaproteobacteria bacterium]|nr:MAG: DNA replication/repair protein RecF [Gammaproteobacteria bacterium]